MTVSLPDIDELKSHAKRLRQAMADRGTPVTHAAALELIARQYGLRDWNTLSAIASREAPRPTLPFAVGASVGGRYLGQPFKGKVLSLSTQGGNLFKVVIHFDQPVDVVTFESFSALRSRINAQVDINGVSPRKTSNGLPQLQLDI